MDVPQFIADMLDEVAVMKAVKTEYPSFVEAMQTYRASGMSYDDSITSFRSIVANTPREVASADEVALLLRVFDLSVEKYRRDVEIMRAIAAWVPESVDEDHEQEVAEQIDSEQLEQHPAEFDYDAADKRHDEKVARFEDEPVSDFSDPLDRT